MNEKLARETGRETHTYIHTPHARRGSGKTERKREEKGENEMHGNGVGQSSCRSPAACFTPPLAQLSSAPGTPASFSFYKFPVLSYQHGVSPVSIGS